LDFHLYRMDAHLARWDVSEEGSSQTQFVMNELIGCIWISPYTIMKQLVSDWIEGFDERRAGLNRFISYLWKVSCTWECQQL
jgi:hypothetical protein